MTVDGFKAAKQDFDALRAARKSAQEKRDCDDAKSGASRAGSTNPALEEGAGLVADISGAFASQGASFYATFGMSVVTGSMGVTPCTIIGGTVGYFHADGSATRAVERSMNMIAEWLGGE